MLALTWLRSGLNLRVHSCAAWSHHHLVRGIYGCEVSGTPLEGFVLRLSSWRLRLPAFHPCEDRIASVTSSLLRLLVAARFDLYAAGCFMVFVMLE